MCNWFREWIQMMVSCWQVQRVDTGNDIMCNWFRGGIQAMIIFETGLLFEPHKRLLVVLGYPSDLKHFCAILRNHCLQCNSAPPASQKKPWHQVSCRNYKKAELKPVNLLHTLQINFTIKWQDARCYYNIHVKKQFKEEEQTVKTKVKQSIHFVFYLHKLLLTSNHNFNLIF